MHVHAGNTRLFFDVDGPRWDYDRAGRFVERPTIIVLHGGPGPDHRRGKLWARRLTASAQVIYLDQRGHGQSDIGSPATWRLADWADDVAHLCAALAIERPVVLGVSFGGFVAQTLAIRHPGLPRGLVLMSTAARNDPDRIAAAMARAGGSAAAAVARAFYQGPRDVGTGADYARLCLPLYATTELPDVDEEPWNVAVTAAFTDPERGEFLHDDRRAALGAVRIPTLILAGERDPVTPVESAAELLDAFPPGVARLRTYPGASHALPFDAPDCLDEIGRFVGELP